MRRKLVFHSTGKKKKNSPKHPETPKTRKKQSTGKPEGGWKTSGRGGQARGGYLKGMQGGGSRVGKLSSIRFCRSARHVPQMGKKKKKKEEEWNLRRRPQAGNV